MFCIQSCTCKTQPDTGFHIQKKKTVNHARAKKGLKHLYEALNKTCHNKIIIIIIITRHETRLQAFSRTINSFLTDDDTRRFCGQHRSRSDCTEYAV